MRKFTIILLSASLLSMGQIFAQSKPYLGTPQAIPGVIRPELYDLGGEGVAYHDDATTDGKAFRANEKVDLEIATVGSYANGYDLGWTNAGEWENYTVDVKQSGKYNVTALFASGGAGGNLVLKSIMAGDTTIIDTLKFSGTTGWQAWDTLETSVNLKQGVQILQYAIGGGFNLNTITFSYDYQLGSNNIIPGVIPVQNFGLGGEGVAYHITNTVKNGDTTVRHDDIVSLEPASIGGYDLGWTNSGNWIKYPVNIDSTADYQLTLWIAAGNTGSQTLNVEFSNDTSVILIEGTGGWQTYKKFVDTIHLTKGQDTMRLMEVTGGINITSPTFRLLDTKITTLDSIKVDGKLLSGFSSSVNFYFGKRITIPTVEAYATDPNAYVKVVTDTVPGVTNIIVTAADSSSANIYQIAWANPVKITTLSEIKLAGKAIAGFTSAKKIYDIMLPAGTTSVPMVTAKAVNKFATVKVTPAKEIPGATTILVTAEDTSVKVTITINFTDSLAEGVKTNEISSFSVYPNPASSQIVVKFNNADNSAVLPVSIYSITGQIVLTSNVSNNGILDINKLEQGVYFVKVSGSTQIFTSKLIKK